MNNMFIVVDEILNRNYFSENPLVFDVYTYEEFEKYQNQPFIFIFFLEDAKTRFGNKINYLNNKIDNNIYWFDSFIDLDQLNDFLISIIIEKNKKYKKQIILKDVELENKGCLVFCFEFRNKIYFKYELDNTIYQLDLMIYNFFSQNKINNTFEFGSLQENLIKENIVTFFDTGLNNLSPINIRLKENSFVDKKYKLEKWLEFLFDKMPEIETATYLLDVFSNIINIKTKQYIAKSLEISEFNITTDLPLKILNQIKLDNYKNSYKNLVFVEEYLSKIEITSLNLEKYTDLYFPINQNKKIQYSYNGSYTVTGRIYANNLKNYQSLQTLQKKHKDILEADEDCVLIEFDYKTFEFDLVLQLCGVEINKKFDSHIDVVLHSFGEEFVKKYNKEEIRALGKSINYSYIYGMNLESLIEEMTGNKYECNLDLIKKKLQTYEYFLKIRELRQEIYKRYYIEKDSLLINKFFRFLHIEKEYAALNNFIQSLAADFLYIKIRMIVDLLNYNKLDLQKNKIIIQNHDSILLQLEENIAENTEILDDIIKIMKCKLNNLKGRVEFKYGTNWKFLSS